MTDRISIGMDPATVRTVTYGVVAVSVVALAAFAMVQERGTYDMALGDGGLVIKVSKDEDLTTIIQRAVKLEDGKSDSSARAVLREEGIIVLDDADGGSEDSLTRTKLSEAGFFHIGGAGGNEDQLTRTKLTEAGYFRIGDDTLAKQLVELDYAEFEQMRDEFHKMLWDLRGPFEERTLSGASGTFLAAFEELYADLDENKRTTPLLDEMWRRSMAWETPFKRRSFSAAVELLPETAPADRIYACSGAEHLERKYVNVSIPAKDDPRLGARGTGMIERRVVIDERVYPCRGGAGISDMLSGTSMRFAMAPELARQIILPGSHSGPAPEKFEAQFLVRPLNLVSVSEVETQ